MENESSSKSFKLNYKRIFLIGFAFFGILLLWQVYDSWCPTFLTEAFKEALHVEETDSRGNEKVQYLVGIVMAVDNLAALILLPIFGHLSDKTRTPIGKRMPYILLGTFVCAVAFPFIPLFFHYNKIVGMIIMMFIVVIFAMMYRNPAVALMPDITPKPLRSKANGIINIMGYIGGFFGTVVGMVFVLSQYLGSEEGKENTWQYNNIWAIELPFIIASVLMLISALVLFFTIKENEIEAEMQEEMKRGEEEAEIVDKIKDDDAPMSKANKTMLILILAAEFFWFMADNGISTFMGNYTVYYLGASTRSNSMNTIMGGVGSIIGFILGGIIASKIGRKKTLLSGLSISLLAYTLWIILNYTILKGSAGSGKFPWEIYMIWFFKGFGMSLVHVNSYPMIVELCPSKKIGAFTGYYYASSMGAQTITPIALGSLLLIDGLEFSFLPIYAAICLVISVVIFIFVPNVKTNKTKIKKGLEALDQDD